MGWYTAAPYPGVELALFWHHVICCQNTINNRREREERERERAHLLLLLLLLLI
jgi:hypothetical protein